MNGRSDGVFYAYSPESWKAWPIYDIRSGGTCEVVARVLSDNPTKTAAWQVLVDLKSDLRGFLIKINGKGELFLEPIPWKGAEAFRQIDPRMGPIRHPAIKPGNEFNKLLLLLRKREVVIFVNGIQACDPVRFDYDVTPAVLCFGAAGPGPKRAEFDRLEIREMMQPDDKPPKAEATPKVTQAAVKPADRPKPGPTRRDNPTKPITNSIGMKLVLIPAGEFLMGSPDGDDRAFDNEKPQHRVRITRPFYLGTTEVTRGQFRRFVDEAGYQTSAEKDDKSGYFLSDTTGQWVQYPKPTWQNPGFEQTDEHPVVNVSWHDAVAFADWMSRKEGRTYRLPTEAEWEYACRAGTATTYSFGDDIANFGENGWFGRNSGRRTNPVGEKRPNPFGLFDMHGNVYEWCSDGYAADYYKGSLVDDPPGPVGASDRVIRGGGWGYPRLARSASRDYLAPGGRSNILGFRLALDQSEAAKASIKPADRPKLGPTRRDNPTKPIANSIGMKLVLIPAGEFLMGSREGEVEDDEHPRHRVRISRPFYLGVTEVTQAQYEAVMGNNPSWFSSNGPGKDQVAGQSTENHAVETVSWLDAVAFCNKLSEKEGLRPFYEIEAGTARVRDWSGPGYRLPTEAEWEYACRAGSQARYSFGDNEWSLGDHGWYNGNSGSQTHPVGQKRGNAFGLDDMHGNVWEWCWDGYAADYYKQSPGDDPTGPEAAAQRVIRGGSWRHAPQDARSARRGRDFVGPELRNDCLGFRLARVQSGR
jgi:formylglycine-generating enzyme required for sulfatase activity